MSNYKLDPWRIATGSSGLATGWFMVLGLPIPDAFDYESFSEQVSQAQGSTALDGYAFITIVWNVLTPIQAYTLKTMITTVRTAGTPLYLTCPRNDGDKCKVLDFIDVSGYPNMPRFTSPPNSYGRAYSPVELKVNNLTTVNDPASGV